MESLHLADRGQNTSGSLLPEATENCSHLISEPDRFQRSKSQAKPSLAGGHPLPSQLIGINNAWIMSLKLPSRSIYLRQVLEEAKSTGDPALFSAESYHGNGNV